MGWEANNVDEKVSKMDGITNNMAGKANGWKCQQRN